MMLMVIMKMKKRGWGGVRGLMRLQITQHNEEREMRESDREREREKARMVEIYQ